MIERLARPISTSALARSCQLIQTLNSIFTVSYVIIAGDTFLRFEWLWSCIINICKDEQYLNDLCIYKLYFSVYINKYFAFNSFLTEINDTSLKGHTKNRACILSPLTKLCLKLCPQDIST